MSIQIVRRQEMEPVFQNGYSRTEMLPGGYNGVTNYKCALQAGGRVAPERFADKIQILCFTSGTGYVAVNGKAWNIEEISFFIPDFDDGEFYVSAETDMEFLQLVVDMSADDMDSYNDTHMSLPYFVNMTSAIEYDQSCKGPTTRSWYIIPTAMLARIMMGVVRSDGGDGTTEPGHAHVTQWNYALPGSDFTLTVGDESVETKDGDWSYVPAGVDHSLLAEKGKTVFYIWFEHFVTPKDFIVYPTGNN